MSSVVGSDLYMVYVKHSRNETLQESCYELCLDGFLSNLNGIVVKNLQSKFVQTSCGYKYFMKNMDNSQFVTLELLKGLRCFGWSLLSSHAYSHTLNNEVKIETNFYFEINSANFISLINNMEIEYHQGSNNDVTTISPVDTSKYAVYETKSSSPLKSDQKIHSNDIRSNSPSFRKSAHDEVTNGVANSLVSPRKTSHDPEYAAFLLDSSIGSQTGPYGFARLHAAQTGHSPKPRKDSVTANLELGKEVVHTPSTTAPKVITTPNQPSHVRSSIASSVSARAELEKADSKPVGSVTTPPPVAAVVTRKPSSVTFASPLPLQHEPDILSNVINCGLTAATLNRNNLNISESFQSTQQIAPESGYVSPEISPQSSLSYSNNNSMQSMPDVDVLPVSLHPSVSVNTTIQQAVTTSSTKQIPVINTEQVTEAVGPIQVVANISSTKQSPVTEVEPESAATKLAPLPLEALLPPAVNTVSVKPQTSSETPVPPTANLFEPGSVAAVIRRFSGTGSTGSTANNTPPVTATERPVSSHAPSAADKLFQKYSHRKSITMTTPSPLKTAPPVVDNTNAVGGVVSTNVVAAAPHRASLVVNASAPITTEVTQPSTTPVSAANKLFSKYNIHRRPSSINNNTAVAAASTTGPNEAVATINQTATESSATVPVAKTVLPRKSLSGLFSEVAEEEEKVKDSVVKPVNSQSTTTTTTSAASLSVDSTTPVDSNNTIQLSQPPSYKETASETMLVHHSQLASIVGLDSNSRKSIGGFRRVKSNSILQPGGLTPQELQQLQSPKPEEEDDYGDVSVLKPIEFGRSHDSDDESEKLHKVQVMSGDSNKVATAVSITPTFAGEDSPSTRPPLAPSTRSLRGSLHRPKSMNMDVDPFASDPSQQTSIRRQSDDDDDYGDLSRIKVIEHGKEVGDDSPMKSTLPPSEAAAVNNTVRSGSPLTPTFIIRPTEGESKLSEETQRSPSPALVIVSPAVAESSPVVVSTSSLLSPVSSVDGVSPPDEYQPAQKRLSKFIAPNPMEAMRSTLLAAGGATKADNSTDEEKRAALVHEDSRTNHYAKLGSAFVTENVLSVGRGGGRGRGAGRGMGIRHSSTSSMTGSA